MSDPVKSLVITERPTRDEVLMTPEQLAERWSVKPGTLANMRGKGYGPRYRKFPNGMIRYPEWAVFDYEMRKDAA